MSQRRISKCPTPSKVGYEHSREAFVALGNDKAMRPYVCACGWYHLGHPFKAASRIQRALRVGSAASARARRVRSRR